jgi:tRNA (pseudouridine54-N1)-methyltransferase
MREFIYFSNNARTSGSFNSSKLMEAGRMDIAIHAFINVFFLSNKLREKTKLHLIFNGPPNPPQHLEIYPQGNKTSGSITLSKKNVAGLIKKMLYKSSRDKKVEIEPGYTIEKKSLFKVLEEMDEKQIYILDSKGKDIRNISFDKNPIIVIADQEGFNKKELKKLKSFGTSISVGKETYFASQVITIVNNELDRQVI